MKQRFTLFRRGLVFYSQDTTTGQPTSLRTKEEAEACTLLHSKNEAHRQPVLNLQIARTYLSATDPEIARRSWRAVMDEMAKTKTGVKDAAFDSIRDVPILETQATHLLRVLEAGCVSTKYFPSSPPQFCVGDELAALAHPAEKTLAENFLQGKAGGHVERASGYRCRVSTIPNAAPITNAAGTLATLKPTSATSRRKTSTGKTSW